MVYTVIHMHINMVYTVDVANISYAYDVATEAAEDWRKMCRAWGVYKSCF